MEGTGESFQKQSEFVKVRRTELYALAHSSLVIKDQSVEFQDQCHVRQRSKGKAKGILQDLVYRS